MKINNLDQLYLGHEAASVLTVSTSYAAKCDEHWFYGHLAECVKACNNVNKIPFVN